MFEIRLQVDKPRLDTLSKSNGGRGGAHHRGLHGKRLLDGNCDRERIVSGGGISGSARDGKTYAVAATAEQPSERT